MTSLTVMSDRWSSVHATEKVSDGERSRSLLHRKLTSVEYEVSNLADLLINDESELLDSSTNEAVKVSLITTNVDETKSRMITVVSPLPTKNLNFEQGEEKLILRVCHAEGAIKTLRDTVMRISKERDRCQQDKVAANDRFTRAADAFQQEVLRFKHEINKLQSDVKHAEQAKNTAENKAQTLQMDLEISSSFLNTAETELDGLRLDNENLLRLLSSIKEELGRERELRLTLEQSQLALTQHVREMETVIEAEREQVKNLAANCNNLKQDGCYAVEQYSKDQMLLIELQEKYQNLMLEKETTDNLAKSLSTENCQLLTDTQTLEGQYASLISQLDDMRKLVSDRQGLHAQLEQENGKLRASLKSLESEFTQQIYDFQNNLARKYATSAVGMELDDLRSQLKDAILDETIHQQRSGQLQIELTDLKEKLSNEQDELKHCCDELREENESFRKQNELIGLEKELISSEKASLVDKLTETSDLFANERSALEAQLNELRVELLAATSTKRKLEHENKLIFDELHALKQQQQSYSTIEHTLSDLSKQGVKLAYDNGLLKSTVKQLQTELESMPGLITEVTQLRKASHICEAKFIKLHGDLVASRMHANQLESELNQTKLSVGRRDTDFQLAINSRDEACQKNDRLSLELEGVRKNQQQMMNEIQKKLLDSRAENTHLSSTLETVVASHAALQSTMESLQSESSSRNTQVSHLQRCILELTHERDTAVHKEQLSQQALATTSELVSTSTNPLQRELERLKVQNNNLVESSVNLQAQKDQLKAELSRLKDVVLLNSQTIDKLKAASELKDNDYAHEIMKLREKNEAFKHHIMREKDISAKLKIQLSAIAYRQMEKVSCKNETLNRTKKDCKMQMAVIEGRLQETQAVNVSLAVRNEQLQQSSQQAKERLQVVMQRLTELEEERLDGIRKNQDQAKIIEDFVSDVSEMKVDFKTLNWQTMKNTLSPNELVSQNTDAGSHEISVHESFVQSNNSADHTRPHQIFIDEKKRTEETIRRAKAVVTKGCRAITLLANMATESSISDTDVNVNTLSKQLQKEKNRCHNLEMQLKLVQATSLKHIEQLALELNAVKNRSLSS